MGGHAGGAIASAVAVEGFKTAFASSRTDNIGQQLDQGLRAGNAAIARRRESDPALDGMGCTLIGAHFENSSLRWISVGDSLVLHYRAGEVRRLNANHSLGAELDRMAERKEITAEQARSDPMRHALRSAVTGADLPLIDLPGEPFALKPGDWIVIASDGLDTLDKNAIRNAIEKSGSGGAQAVVNRLISDVEAAGRPHQDNTTVMVVRVPGPVMPATGSGGAWHPSTAMIMAAALGGVVFVMFVLGFLIFGGEDEPSSGATQATIHQEDIHSAAKNSIYNSGGPSLTNQPAEPEIKQPDLKVDLPARNPLQTSGQRAAVQDTPQPRGDEAGAEPKQESALDQPGSGEPAKESQPGVTAAPGDNRTAAAPKPAEGTAAAPESGADSPAAGQGGAPATQPDAVAPQPPADRPLVNPSGQQQ
ncbi:MAG: SpoIIE family protein phosphatase [Rhodomicrobium sp.]|nr:SpoIIE family protein phosphatase [Rhodomicrobium sp.]